MPLRTQRVARSRPNVQVRFCKNVPTVGSTVYGLMLSVVIPVLVRLLHPELKNFAFAARK